ncbi:hypothetical protein OAA34_00470 [bacterium]|nr:hypothetical protein [bacterium]
MDPITHTIIAMVSLIIAYAIGWFMGEKRGAIVGVAIILDWIEKKVGRAQVNRWMKEYEESNN